MRRYRYGDPAVTGFRKWGTLIYFLAAWNVFGFVAYKLWSNKKRDQNPEWDKLSSTQKYMQLINIGNRNVETIKISGFSIQESKKESEEESET